MTPIRGYVTVVVEQIDRRAAEALLKRLEKIPQTYTPLGIGAAAFAEAIREALDESRISHGEKT